METRKIVFQQSRIFSVFPSRASSYCLACAVSRILRRWHSLFVATHTISLLRRSEVAAQCSKRSSKCSKWFRIYPGIEVERHAQPSTMWT